jgi:hypothetical protein
MSDTRPDSEPGTLGPGLGARASTGTAPLDLDSAIDAVAREMTAGEPSGDLRARVLDGIAGGRRPSPLPRWSWAAAAAVLAVAAGVWVVNRPPGAPGEPVRVAASRPSAPSGTPPVTEPAATPAPATPDTAAPVRTARASAPPAARPVESDAAADAHHVPALAEIDPLSFAAVEPAPLRVGAVEVAALTAIPPIEIPSLGPGPDDNQSAGQNKER